MRHEKIRLASRSATRRQLLFGLLDAQAMMRFEQHDTKFQRLGPDQKNKRTAATEPVDQAPRASERQIGSNANEYTRGLEV